MRGFFHDVLLLKGMSLKKFFFFKFHIPEWKQRHQCPTHKSSLVREGTNPCHGFVGKGVWCKKKKKSAKTNVWIHLLWGPLVNKGTAERRFGSSDTVTVLLWPNSNPNLIFKKNTEEKSSKYFISSRFCLFNDYSSTSVYTLICTHLVYYLLIQVGWPRFIPPAPLTG